MTDLLNFKSFLKFLRKNSGYTAINIFGLSISLMFVILIAMYTKQELSIEKNQKNNERIYILANEKWVGSAWKLKPRLLEHFPEIEDIAPTVTSHSNQSVEAMNETIKADLLFSDTSFFKVFSFPILEGDPYKILEDSKNAVISESFARKVFGSQDPIGQTIRIKESVNLTVKGIMKDIKNSVLPNADILLSIENIGSFNSSLTSEAFDNAGGTDLFILVRENANLHTKIPNIEEYFRETFWIYKSSIAEKVVLHSLKDFYFSGKDSSNKLRQGDWNFVMILMSVGILILVFAVINYINLTVTQTSQRAKEMAVRSLLGSLRGELFGRLILESFLLSFISFIVGILLAIIMRPYANDLLQSNIDLSGAFTIGNILTAIVFIALLSIISGLLPAWIISKTKPIDIVRGTFKVKTKMTYSKIFITFQNVITIMMIAASITMVLQTNHMINAPLGYNTKNIINIRTYQFKSKDQMFNFGNEVGQLASVNRVAYGAGTPFDRGNNNTVIYDDKNVSFQVLVGDSAYFSIFGFEILHKNQIGSDAIIYLNEQTYRELMVEDDATSLKLGDHFNISIAGKIKDFRMGNVLANLPPTQLILRNHDQFYPWSVLIEIKGDAQQAFAQVKDKYESMTGIEFPGIFIEKQIENSFQTQRRISKIVMIFCVIAILISLLGLFAMSTYFIQQRTREIAVRKVFGSSEGQMLKRLISTFLNNVLIGFVIATPIIWYIMRLWISDYSYKIFLSPLIFIVAGLFCLLTSFITVYWQSYKAANANPVDSMKAE